MIRLPRPRRDVKLVENGLPTLTFHQWLDTFITRLENSLTNIDANIAGIQTSLDAAISGINETARITSYTQPTVVLTAADVGTTATITVAAHTRIYAINGPYDIPDVAVLAGTITGLLFSTQYWVYYDDTTLVNGTPTYVATTSIADAQIGATSGRHFVGTITTPADGAGGTTGTGATPLGNGGILP